MSSCQRARLASRAVPTTSVGELMVATLISSLLAGALIWAIGLSASPASCGWGASAHAGWAKARGHRVSLVAKKVRASFAFNLSPIQPCQI